MKLILSYFFLLFTCFIFSQKTINTKPIFEKKIPLNNATGGQSAEIIDGKLYFLGGRSEDAKSYDAYHLDTDNWEKISRPSINFTDASSESIGQKIYIFGGYRDTNKTQIYDLEKNTWELGKDKAEKFDFVTSESYEKKIFLFGGYQNKWRWKQKNQSITNHEYAIYNTEKDQWFIKKLPASLVNRGNIIGSVKHESTIYVWNLKNDIFSFNPKNGKWSYVGNYRLPKRDYFKKAVSYNNKIIFFTSCSNCNIPKIENIVWFDPKTKKQKISSFKLKNRNRTSYLVRVYNHQLFVIGGMDMKKFSKRLDIEVYNLK